MTAPDDNKLEARLAELTQWHGPTPALWRRALQAATEARAAARRRFWPALHRPLSTSELTGVAACIIGGVALIGVMTTTFHGGIGAGTEYGSSAGTPASHVPAHAERTARAPSASVAGEHRVSSNDNTEWFPYAASGGGGGRTGSEGFVAFQASGGASPLAQGGPPADAAQDRQVIRKATIELACADVRAAFLKAGQLPSEARGEYVQDSALTGSERSVQANLTLRVAADRLATVLNELRQLGEVRSEQTGGEDVTAQAVDLEARLRNERRVETELLELMEKRKDAPLKEILELRAALGGVRQSIELLSGQRERLSRLVALATVLVILRPADAPPPELLDYFLKALGTAWTAGVRFLVDTLAWLVATLVGGAFWWATLVIAALLARRYLRRASARDQA